MRYVTTQRKALLDALEERRDEPLSAEQILALIGDGVSRSAVYRNLAELEKRGMVIKATSSGSNKALYKYIGSEECRDHLHLECSNCGRVFHLKLAATNTLIDGVMCDANFRVDRAATVLYGLCEKCRESRSCDITDERR